MGKDVFSLPVGTILNGKYQIRSHLSSGGFGKTYFAVYGSHDTKVAIKEFFLNAANLREADGVSVSIDRTKEHAANVFTSQLAKFKKEYERLKQISNVHVVKVHEYFEENGTAYYVMDFVEGDDLRGRLEQRGTPYAEKTVLRYLKQLLDGLAAIHSVGLLHLDIKPSNIMVTSRGYIKLIDLGASKDYIAGTGATIHSSIALTNKYAPLEQAEGSFDKFGPWTDFYALGATVYYLLTGNEIPTSTDISEDNSYDKHKALPMPGISDKTKRLVVWLMSTDRKERPQSVREILKYMESIRQETSSRDNTIISHDNTIISPGKEEETIVAAKQPIPKPKVARNIQPPKPQQEEEPEFSVVGCIYILAIIAIVVFIVKFLFFS